MWDSAKRGDVTRWQMRKQKTCIRPARQLPSDTPASGDASRRARSVRHADGPFLVGAAGLVPDRYALSSGSLLGMEQKET